MSGVRPERFNIGNRIRASQLSLECLNSPFEWTRHCYVPQVEFYYIAYKSFREVREAISSLHSTIRSPAIIASCGVSAPLHHYLQELTPKVLYHKWKLFLYVYIRAQS